MKPTVLAGPFATLLTVLFLVAVPAANQSQPSKWWNAEPIRRELGLTPEQSQTLEEIFQAAIPTQRNLKKALDDAEAQFERLVNERDKVAAAEQIQRVEAARAELKKSHSLMLLEMRFVLTRDQWTRFGALQLAAEKERTPDKAAVKSK
jgi:Spy/CpxP family protein refolding chaperone